MGESENKDPCNGPPMSKTLNNEQADGTNFPNTKW